MRHPGVAFLFWHYPNPTYPPSLFFIKLFDFFVIVAKYLIMATPNTIIIKI